MKTDYASMPDELPESLTGKDWKKKLLMHLNFGSKGGICAYEIFDERDRSMPFQYQIGSKSNLTGFILPGVKPIMTWKELREIWPIWIKKARAKQTASSLPTTQQQGRVSIPGANEHLTKNTLETTAYCGRCGARTQHRVDNGRRGPCLECLKKRTIEAEANRIKRGMDKEQAEEYDRQNPKLF